ncbi:unnamed protein product, partial [Discosporangium mesarthrocarpum]
MTWVMLTSSTEVSLDENQTALYAMSEEERGRYNRTFRKMDADEGGTIDRKEAAEAMRKSGLPKETLAKIWSMADKE